jgi:hypothetical protein
MPSWPPRHVQAQFPAYFWFRVRVPSSAVSPAISSMVGATWLKISRVLLEKPALGVNPLL